MSNQFIALDFETANSSPASICSVGMVKVVDKHMTETFYTLVDPEARFSEGNIRVHGITPRDVQESPTFEDVFPYMMNFIGDLPIVAHNASFDMKVLYASLDRYEIEVPPIQYFCSVQMGRRTVQNHSYSLSNMMKFYNIDFKGHHHALNDAKAAAMITYRLLEHYPSLEDYLKSHKKYLRTMKNNKSKSAAMSQYNDALLQIKPTEDVTDDTHPFFDKKIAISGTLFLKRKELVQYIVNNGGTYTINDDMDIFIHGKNRGNTPSKKEQIVRNKLAMGKDIVLINNEKLKSLIDFYNSLKTLKTRN